MTRNAWIRKSIHQQLTGSPPVPSSGQPEMMIRIEQIELPRFSMLAYRLSRIYYYYFAISKKCDHVFDLERRTCRTHSCRHVSTRSGSRFSTTESVAAPWLYRKKSVFSSPIRGWKYARRLEERFLQVLSKKGTSNVSVVKFRVVDTNGHARNPIHLNASDFNYPFVGCFCMISTTEYQ